MWKFIGFAGGFLVGFICSVVVGGSLIGRLGSLNTHTDFCRDQTSKHFIFDQNVREKVCWPD